MNLETALEILNPDNERQPLPKQRDAFDVIKQAVKSNEDDRQMMLSAIHLVGRIRIAVGDSNGELSQSQLVTRCDYLNQFEKDNKCAP